jgi:hypothetical protein
MEQGSDVWVIEEDGIERTTQIKFSYNELVPVGDRIETRANFSPTSNCTYFAIVSKTTITFLERSLIGYLKNTVILTGNILL